MFTAQHKRLHEPFIQKRVHLPQYMGTKPFQFRSVDEHRYVCSSLSSCSVVATSKQWLVIGNSQTRVTRKYVVLMIHLKVKNSFFIDYFQLLSSPTSSLTERGELCQFFQRVSYLCVVGVSLPHIFDFLFRLNNKHFFPVRSTQIHTNLNRTRSVNEPHPSLAGLYLPNVDRKKCNMEPPDSRPGFEI